MEKLTDNLANKFVITDSEDQNVAVDDEQTESNTTNWNPILVGRVVSSRQFSPLSLSQNLTRLLSPVRGFEFHDLGSNKFSLEFNHKVDLANAMDGNPWLIDRCAVLLTPLPMGMDPTLVEINDMTIVVRLYIIPFSHRNQRVVEQIGNSLGSFLDLIPSKHEGLNDYMRIKVRLDVRNILKRGVHLRVRERMRQWISLTYERLPLFCFICGIIGHIEKKCPMHFSDTFVDPGTDFPYDDWLKAISWPGASDALRLPLQPLSVTHTRSSQTNSRRGSDIFSLPQLNQQQLHPSLHVDGLENVPVHF